MLFKILINQNKKIVLQFLILLLLTNCNISKERREDTRIERIFFFPLDREGTRVKGFILTPNSFREKEELWKIPLYTIALSDSSLLEMKRMVDTPIFVNYKDYSNPHDLSFYYEYEVLITDKSQDTILHKVINRLKDKEVFIKILNLIEFDNRDSLVEQKKNILNILRSKYDIE